nr:zinc finger, CCHC-type [Tanacetum cinerariifolium]
MERVVLQKLKEKNSDEVMGSGYLPMKRKKSKQVSWISGDVQNNQFDLCATHADFRDVRVLRIGWIWRTKDIVQALGRDTVGKAGISALVKCTSAIRQLAYGAVPDSLDEYLQIGDKTSRNCLMAFYNGVMELYVEEFLHRSTQTDVEKLYSFHEEKHGFSGSNNDVNVLRQSTVLNDLKVGKAQEAKELRDQLESKYKAEDASSKKFLVSNFNNYKMVDSSTTCKSFSHKETLRAKESGKGKGKEIDGSSSVNMIEDGKNKNNKKNTKGKKRKNDGNNDGCNKKSKLTYWKCGKTGHFKKDCRVKKNNGGNTSGSGQGSKDPKFITRAVVRLPEPKRKILDEKATYNLVIHQMDIKTTFLNDDLEEEAPKQWHQKFDEVVLSCRFVLNQFDKCVYCKFDKSGNGVIICLYVDDMLMFGTDQDQVDKTKEFLSSNFSMKNMGEADVILGIRIKREDKGAISWVSKKQTCITDSTMEAEFVALAAAGEEAEWLRNMIYEILLWPKPISPISTHCDSATTLAKSYCQIYNEKSRHLGVRYSMKAPKQWHQKFDEVVLSCRFVLNQFDKCVYCKFDKSGNGVIICLYVDDMLMFGTDQDQVDKTKEFLSSNFSMKNMGEADVILGIRIKREDKGITITQSHYIEKILKKFKCDDCCPVTIPLDLTIKRMPNTGRTVDQLEYSRSIGCLMYAMTSKRPYIAYVISKLSRYTSNHSIHQWHAIMRVVKYLKKTVDYGLSYVRFSLVLEGYSDASCITNSEDHTSTTEFVALAAAGEEAEWLRNMIYEILLWPKPISPISTHCDSATTLAKSYCQIYNEKSRHLDHLTKGLARDLVHKSAIGMGLNSIKIYNDETHNSLLANPRS